jgi:hypothetical protein
MTFNWEKKLNLKKKKNNLIQTRYNQVVVVVGNSRKSFIVFASAKSTYDMCDIVENEKRLFLLRYSFLFLATRVGAGTREKMCQASKEKNGEIVDQIITHRRELEERKKIARLTLIII